MRKLLFLMLIITSFNVFSQDIKMKKQVITVDEKEWAKYDGCGIFDTECSILKGDNEVALVNHKVNDPAKREPSNPDGGVSWYEVKFLGKNKLFDIFHINSYDV